MTELQEDTAPAAGYMCGPSSVKGMPLIRDLQFMGLGSTNLPEPTDVTGDPALLRSFIIAKLPPKEDALYLVNVYYDRVAWLCVLPLSAAFIFIANNTFSPVTIPSLVPDSSNSPSILVTQIRQTRQFLTTI